jgi:hypothetical protein
VCRAAVVLTACFMDAMGVVDERTTTGRLMPVV